jgi:hypothetical protein
MVMQKAGSRDDERAFAFMPVIKEPSTIRGCTPLAAQTARAIDALVAGCDHAVLLGVWGAHPAADQCRALVRLLCAEGREDDARRAERLVVRIRAAWPTLPSVQRLPVGPSRNALLDRLVSACIAAFYVVPGDPLRLPEKGA